MEGSLRKRDIYEGKYFYEILKPIDGGKDITLSGPLPGMRYVQKANEPALNELHEGIEYDYVQVIKGKPVQAFTKEEILVTNRRL